MKVPAKCRLVNKDGNSNVKPKRLHWKALFNQETLLEMKWTPLFVLIIITFLSLWVLFGLAYWFMNKEDIFHLRHLGGVYTHDEKVDGGCVIGVGNFSSALLFSVETMTTIGYGERIITGHCPIAILVVTFQSLLGIVLASTVTAIIMTKFSIPRKKRKSNIRFSKKAVVQMRTGGLYLVVKVADRGNYKLEGVRTESVLVSSIVTKEGEVITNNFVSMKFGIEKNSRLPILWPICIAHEIDSTSPLYHFHPDMIDQAEFEIVLWVTGLTSTGGRVSARTSFLASEIVWGGTFRFDHDYIQSDTHVTVLDDYVNFDEILVEQLPRVSAATLESFGV